MWARRIGAAAETFAIGLLVILVAQQFESHKAKVLAVIVGVLVAVVVDGLTLLWGRGKKEGARSSTISGSRIGTMAADIDSTADEVIQ